jgi:hypothetical protein
MVNDDRMCLQLWKYRAINTTTIITLRKAKMAATFIQKMSKAIY